MSKRKKESRTAKAVVVVESPAKARTINRYLGSDYTVKASLGHVRDLPKNRFGIDLTDNFRPTYEIVRGRARVLAELKQATGKASEVYLATDRDREGEAIAWHLTEALNLPPEKVRRVVFNEITRSAIAEAFAHPHQIDMDRVNAQQARRILDRIVGYELSPLLWKKVAKGLSAGRVQSVAVRLIVDREREIRAFVPQESWKIVASVTPRTAAAGELAEAWRQFLASEPAQKEIQNWLTDREAFRVELAEVAGEPFRVTDADAAARIATALGYQIERIDRPAPGVVREDSISVVCVMILDLDGYNVAVVVLALHGDRRPLRLRSGVVALALVLDLGACGEDQHAAEEVGCRCHERATHSDERSALVSGLPEWHFHDEAVVLQAVVGVAFVRADAVPKHLDVQTIIRSRWLEPDAGECVPRLHNGFSQGSLSDGVVDR